MKPRLGRYKLLRKLAQGGMAQVYLARQAGADGFSKKVVIKRIGTGPDAEDPQFRDMFVSEAMLAAQLNHPNVVHVYDFAEANGERFIVMEYVDGPSLRALIKLAKITERILPISHVLKIASWVCEGLGYAHQLKHERTGEPLNVVHRDITPDNILVTRTGVVKIIDFGIAKATTQVHQTRPGEMKGKLSYVAPEQLLSQPLDGRADLFSLGVVLYEALTGTSPFGRDNPAAVMDAIVRSDIPPVSQLRPEAPPGLDALIAKATAKNPADRYQSALELQTAIEAELVAVAPNFTPARLRELVQSLDPAQPVEEEDTTTADSLSLTALGDDDPHTEVFLTGPHAAVPAPGRIATQTNPKAAALPFEFAVDDLAVPPPVRSATETRLSPPRAMTPSGSKAMGLPVGARPTGPSLPVVAPPVATPGESSGRVRVTGSSAATPGESSGRVRVTGSSAATPAGEASGRLKAPLSSPPRPATVPPPQSDLVPRPALTPSPVTLADDRDPDTSKVRAWSGEKWEPPGPPSFPIVPVLIGLMLSTGVVSWFVSAWINRPDPVPQPIVVTVRPNVVAESVVDAGAVAEAAPVVDAGAAAVAELPEIDLSPPAAAAAAAPAVVDAGINGKVQVALKTTPPATVFVNGTKMGETPVQLQLAAGSHKLRFESTDVGLNKSILLRVADAPIEKAYVFERSRLKLDAPEGATIYMGKKKLGAAPLEPIELYEGTYRFRALASDQGIDVTKTIEVKPGDSVEKLGP